MSDKGELGHFGPAGPDYKGPSPTRRFKNHSWFLAEMISAFSFKKIAEIGILEGETSLFVLKHSHSIIDYYMIDPWKEYPESQRDPNYDYWKQDYWDSVYVEVVKKTQSYKDKAHVLRLTSQEAAQVIEDESLDLVFIDAFDTYEDEMDYIKTWLPKVKPTGIIAGHDWWEGDSDWARRFEGEKRAIIESFGLDIIHIGNPAANWGNAWYVLKEDWMRKQQGEKQEDNISDITLEEWQEHQKRETKWWLDERNIINSIDEENKQLQYATLMDLDRFDVCNTAFTFGKKFHMRGKSILDIGGGPVSLLLKCRGFSRAVVLDPLTWPQWVLDRYKAAGIEYIQTMAETAELDQIFDEVWIYNVLQHTWRPDLVIKTALKYGKKLRVFEWIDTIKTPGHPHILTKEFLDQQFGLEGKVVNLNWRSYTPNVYVLVADVPGQLKAIKKSEQPASDITVTITSTGRFDLLKRTVDSLLATIGRPVKIIISDDSGDETQQELIQKEYEDRFDVYIQSQRLGQAKNLDFLYDLVEMPYIFHCEDDWEFLKGGYIEKSLDVLESRPDITVISLAINDEFRKHGAVGEKHITEKGTVYYDHPKWRISEKHHWWNGWIGSPNLKRKADYLELGQFQRVQTEDQYDKLFSKSGMKSVWLEDTYVKHIGYGRSLFAAGEPHVWVKSLEKSPKKSPKKSPDLRQPPDSRQLLTNSKFRLHYLSLAHVPTAKEISACAYTQKVYKLSRMLMDMGHEVFLYGGEGSDAKCTEFIQVVSNADRVACYGDYDWGKEFFKWDGNDKVHQTFNQNAIREIMARKQPKDFLLCAMGTNHMPIAQAVNQGDLLVVEPGIGYRGIFADFKAFESYFWMSFIYGIRYGWSGTNEQRARWDNGSWYDVVIPNYFDPADFPFQEEKDDYFFYIGRLVRRKGLDIAVQVTKELGAKLIVAGQGTLINPIEKLNITDSHVEHIGTVGPKRRAELMGSARAVFVPTYYLEPFGGVAVEAQMCGTPVLTTDWGAFTETVLHGVTGYRCRTFADFLWAAKNIETIKPKNCRQWTIENYSMDRVAQMYQHYFEQVYDLWEKGEGWYMKHPERKNLDWLTKKYPNQIMKGV